VIITRSPSRISLGGGGTDLPSYYRKHAGFVLAAAIDKYVYITLHETFVEELIIKYSQMERVHKLDEIRHPLIREALRLVGTNSTHLEIASMSDIPAGTGLGSSGSFITALLQALYCFNKIIVPKEQLAERACQIEIDLLHEPVGKQDQYIAAFGGITAFEFLPDDQVRVEPLQLDTETVLNLEDNLMLFFTGYTRAASQILRDQDTRTREMDPIVVNNLHGIKELGYESKRALELGDLHRFAEIMDRQWRQKKERSQGMTNSTIDQAYELGRANGALGGKLIGAGGGGFLMFYTEDKTRLRRIMGQAGFREVRMRFDFQGTSVLVQS
jgi:D-glycero-alpha-D-manno-heptose-7-phosphate kinase